MIKIAIVASAPFYYHAPLYSKLSNSAEIDLDVFFCSTPAVKVSDSINLLEGYKSEFIKNYSPMPSFARGPFGLMNFGIWGKIKNGNYDAVILQAWNNFTWWLAFFACNKFNVPVMFMTDSNVMLESSKFFLKRKLKELMLRYFFKKSAGFLAAGKANEQLYLHYGASPKKISPLPFSWGYEYFLKEAEMLKSDRQKNRELLGIKKDDFVILYVGRLSEEKNLSFLLKAYNNLKNNRKKLIIIGQGQLKKEMEALIRDLNIIGVDMLGFKTREELPVYYSIADSFIMPSKQDALPLAVNEAMCFGLPIIASNAVGSVMDLVKNGYNGFVFPAKDSAALARCLEKMADLPREEVLIFGRRSYEAISRWVGKANPAWIICQLLSDFKKYVG